MEARHTKLTTVLRRKLEDVAAAWAAAETGMTPRWSYHRSQVGESLAGLFILTADLVKLARTPSHAIDDILVIGFSQLAGRRDRCVWSSSIPRPCIWSPSEADRRPGAAG